ncbi:MAG: hypothetical protein Salg2KO_04880 [Salibacteraceae bacterium]
MRFTLVAIITLLTSAACNRTGEIKIQNNISRTTIENIYWGETYIGGALRPGQETEFKEITRFDERLPAANRVFFSTTGLVQEEYYTEQQFELDRQGQLIINLSDSTVIYELD